jgi:hypothetical protein
MKMTCLRIEKKDPCVYSAVSFADAIGQFGLEKQWFACFGVRLYEQGAYWHVTDDALQALLERPATDLRSLSTNHFGRVAGHSRTKDGHAT